MFLDYKFKADFDAQENFLNMMEVFARERRARYGNCEFENNTQGEHIKF